MHSHPPRSSSRHPGPLARFSLLCGLSLLLISGLQAEPVPTSGKPPAYPDWWFLREVIKRKPTATGYVYPADYPVARDFNALNRGQLKQFATAAFDEMEAKMPGGAGLPLTTLVKSWFQTDGSGAFILVGGKRVPENIAGQTNDFAPVNLGQMKATAQLIYDRLIPLGYAPAYPWPGSVIGRNDFAAANIGQAKHVFSFIIPQMTTSDGIPDWWRIKWFGSTVIGTDQAAGDDFDHDSVSNLNEYLQGRNPTQGAFFYPAGVALTVFTPLE